MVTYSNCRPPCSVGDCHQLFSKLEPGEINDSIGRCLARSELCALHVPHCLAQLRCGYASTSLQYSSAPFWPQVALTVIEARGATLKSGGYSPPPFPLAALISSACWLLSNRSAEREKRRFSFIS